MAEPQPITTPAATDADGNLLLSGDEARALLRECFVEFKAGLSNLVRVSIETTNDLFDMNEFVTDVDTMDFRSKREQWVGRFETVLTELFERRIAGTRRQGRRPDFDASLTTLRVLNAFDHEKQAALTTSTQFLYRLTKRELDALDLRVGVLLREPLVREIDNPFSPDYVLDAIGLSSRALYPNPRVWRPLMERVLADVTLGINKTLLRLNRFLADHQVLPEIKAHLRARSELRPRDDSELLPTFLRLFKEAGSNEAEALLALNIVVPDAAPGSAAAAALAARTPFASPPAGPASPRTMTAANDTSPPSVTGPIFGSAADADSSAAAASMAAAGSAANAAASAAAVGSAASAAASAATSAAAAGAAAAQLQAQLNPYIADLARALAPGGGLAVAEPGAMGLPQLDPLMALGSLSAAVAVLDRWQRMDPGFDHRVAVEAPGEGATDGGVSAAAPGDAAMPAAAPASLNRIPFIRAAIGDKVVNTTDKITMDVISLLFDYIFGDPSIPEELRSLFSRLQVPILKTALVDRGFFSERKHPARRVLDHLAAAAIGATGDAGYRAAFELTAAGVVDAICRDFQVDVSVFETADQRLQEFAETEQNKVAGALDTEVTAALAAEASEADRSQVRALIRDKLAGLDVPFVVRSFGETTWADYLTTIRASQGTTGPTWQNGVQTLDDLLWSLTAKERTGQKARLAKLVPGIIRNLRSGAAVVKVGDERVKPLLDAMFQMHIAAINPAAIKPQAATAADLASAAEADANDDGPDKAMAAVPKITNIHDFVSEMVVGTWIAFSKGGTTVNARLSWISPLRSKYIFTSRARSRAIVITPEELAWQLGQGKATLVVEPVPLFDRAVSAALDTLAAQKKPASPAAA